MTDTASRLPPGPRLIEAYYLATPLFFLVDVFLSFPIRVSALADPGLRYLYYAFALGCGVASRVRPKVGPYVGLAESALNILLLILSVMPGQIMYFKVSTFGSAGGTIAYRLSIGFIPD